jgi:DNA-binding response OmpR family regulator
MAREPEALLLTHAGYIGYIMDAVAEGAEALARALREPYQLVVTGVETRGLDLAAAPRQAPGGAALPIIVVSLPQRRDWGAAAAGSRARAVAGARGVTCSSSS